MNRDTEAIRLSFYKPEYKSALLSYELPEEQLKFTGTPIDAIEMSTKENERFPVVILAGDVPVGFFILHCGEGISSITTNLKAILLRTFSINYIYQGKGYAKEAMALLPDFVKSNFPQMEEIVLAVNHANHTAKGLYEKAGFVDQGIRREGPIGIQYLLHYFLS